MDCHSNTRQDMKVMRKYDSLVAFDVPLKMPYDIDKPIYGIAFNLGDCDRTEIEENWYSYIQYLCALCQWVKEGGTICADKGKTWVDKDGNQFKHSIYGGYLHDEYIPSVRAINYAIKFKYNPNLGDEDFFEDTDFIIKNMRKVWKRQ